MKKSRFVGSLAIVLILAVALVGCGNTTTPAKKEFKVGLVTDVGGLNDHSFNYLANQGLVKAKKDLGITEATEKVAPKNFEEVVGISNSLRLLLT